MQFLQVGYRVSERTACGALGYDRSSMRYRCHRDPQEPLCQRLREPAASRLRYGYPRLYIFLRREMLESQS
jgi:putative transposase